MASIPVCCPPCLSFVDIPYLIRKESLVVIVMVMKSRENSKEKGDKSQHLWNEEETAVCLHLMKDSNIMEYINGRKNRYSKIFTSVCEKLMEAALVYCCPRRLALGLFWNMPKKGNMPINM